MAIQGFEKKFLFGTTMIAGFAAMAVAAPAWAQVAVPATPAPAVQTQQPTQPTQVPRVDDEEEDEAQTNADGTEDDQLEGVTVTGSRIRRPEYEGNIPGVQVDSKEIERRGFVNAAEILGDIPLVGPGPALSTAGGQPGSLGVSFIDLLDLGTQRTLSLVNGRRFVGGNAGTLFVSGNATGSQVDVNVIPTSLIDRVDVLTVGGAAAYGSDAIAGVVNYILKTDYEGAEVSAIYGSTAEGDGENYSIRGIVGRNFLDNRLNASVSYEYNFIAAFYENERDFLARNPSAATNFANGSVRNPAFNPRLPATGSNTAFLPTTSDFINSTTYLREASGLTTTDGGTVLQLRPNNASNPTGPVNQIGPVGATALLSNVAQLVPGAPGFPATGFADAGQTCNPSGTAGVQAPAALPFCNFAPTALPPGVTAAQVFVAFGITPPPGLTPAEQNTLAVNILQQNRQTPREFFAANPNTPVNAFLGTFIPALPDIANPDPATNRFLPRLAVPLVFNEQGNLEERTVATLNPTTPGTFGAAPGGQGRNTRRFNDRRIEQERQIATFFANFDVTPNINVFTENLYSSVDTVAPFSLVGGGGNTAASTGNENAALIVNVTNPFLDDADRAGLARVGIAPGVNQGNFVLSRSNQDIFGDNPQFGSIETMRSVIGVRGDFGAFGRNFDWEGSYTWGRSEQSGTQGTIADIEYALAIDAVRAPNGEIVCRVKVDPSIIGTVRPGINAGQLILPGPDGIPTVQNYQPRVTQAQADACVPLNPFGVNQMSEAAKRYVSTSFALNNVSRQDVVQGFISGDLFDLPAGAVGFSVAGEYRTDSLDFTTDRTNQLGGTRFVNIAQTKAETRTYEAGAEFLIPIFGGDFSFPGLYSFDLSPAVRFSQQSGEGTKFRNATGTIISPQSEGDLARIFSLAFTWRPIEDVTFRGNVSRSIRQPSVVELFLGPQPSFAVPTDPCSNANISAGPRPETRRANCIADVIRLGFATDTASANQFLNTFLASNTSREGTSGGTPDLAPERADSYTIGVASTRGSSRASARRWTTWTCRWRTRSWAATSPSTCSSATTA
jgi:outer membrane receptor protein involved in Fe transport